MKEWPHLSNFSFSIVIPVYNEGKSVKNVLVALKNHLDRYSMHYEIIAVNDCSTDDSLEVLKSIDFITLVEHKHNKGYGAALKSGIKKAAHEHILIMDSDGQHNPEDIVVLIEKMQNGYDMAVGARALGNTHKSRVAGKYVIHKLANYIAKYDIPDINSGFRMFKKEDAKNYFHLCSNRFSFTTSLTMAYLSDEKEIAYVPIQVKLRETGKSSVNAKAGLRTILKVLQIGMIFNPLRVLLPIAMFFSVLALLKIIRDIMFLNISGSSIILFTTAITLFVFALMSDQISQIRKEMKNNE